MTHSEERLPSEDMAECGRKPDCNSSVRIPFVSSVRRKGARLQRPKLTISSQSPKAGRMSGPTISNYATHITLKRR